jgi:hypothetical protein
MVLLHMSNENKKPVIFLFGKIFVLKTLNILITSFSKFHFNFLSLFILIFSCLISSCSLDDSSYNNKVIIRNINSDIDTLTLWTKSYEYIIQKSNFSINDTLIIEAGTVIKFDPDSNCSMTISEKGMILAGGTISEHILFTSLFDEKHNIENTSPKENKLPNKGDWESIIINNHINSFFDYCDFYYGGGGILKSTIILGMGNSVNITNCIFAYNDGGDLQTGNGVIDASQSASATKIRSNTFFSNNLPVVVNAMFTMDSTNVFHNPVSVSEVNKYNCIMVKTPSPVNSSISWTEDEVPYVIYGPNFNISPNSSLLFGNNVVIKFMQNSQMTLEGSNSTILNYDGPGVVFTSIFDDIHKGDTNNDGGLTLPQNGDWSISVADAFAFEWTHILYATHLTK